MQFRVGSVERVARGGGGQQAVCRGMFKKETDLSAFAGMQVRRASSCVEGQNVRPAIWRRLAPHVSKGGKSACLCRSMHCTVRVARV